MEMAEHYNYGELAYDLYRANDELLRHLVALREERGMSQEQLAEAMHVSLSVVSEIENGQEELTSLLTDYALEVGARVEYHVERAEEKPMGKRQYQETHRIEKNPYVFHWDDDQMTFGWKVTEITETIPRYNGRGNHRVSYEPVGNTAMMNLNVVLENSDTGEESVHAG